jgi:hypothetical protein
MQNAYTDAAGRTNPTETELGAGNIGGMTLVPGLYKWSSNVTIPTNITLSGDADGVWIFQIAGKLTVSSGVHIILSGGARANNIFWVVAGQTTLRTTVIFNGNILDQTAIVLQTGAVLNGRALAQSAVTLDASSVTVPPENEDITYSWSQSGFGSCSVSCGGGTKTQTVTCINSNSGQTVDNSLCTGTRPITQSCNTQACGSSGGGGSNSNNTTICTEVVYGDYAAACFAGYQYRNVTSRTPSNCSLTAAQQDAAKKLCGVASDVTGDVNGVGLTSGDSNNTANFIALEKNLVKKINQVLTNRLSGRILLQVEENGEAWYVNPLNELKYFLSRPADAFAIMRQLGLGVSEKDYSAFAKSTAPARLAGRILLRVQAHGEAYYVNPLDLKLSYMGRPADAFALMRKFGLGITNANLRQIGVGEIK